MSWAWRWDTAMVGEGARFKQQLIKLQGGGEGERLCLGS